MQISEQELRGMIRDAIARQRSGGERTTDPGPEPVPAARVRQAHASHLMFAVAPGGDGDCIIEPTVRCNHCGYCKSLGH
jgi:hypothetical protein